MSCPLLFWFILLHYPGSFYFTTLVGTSDTFFLMFDIVAYLYTFCSLL